MPCLFLRLFTKESANARRGMKTQREHSQYNLWGAPVFAHFWINLQLILLLGFFPVHVCEEFTDGELRESWHFPPLDMLALRMEQCRRGGGGVDHLQKRTTVAWQGCHLGRPPFHKQSINIRDKISQWEGRSQQVSSQDSGVKAHPPTVLRTLSGDVLDNRGLNVGLHPKVNHSKSLDFQEGASKTEYVAVGRKSEPLLKCSTEFSAMAPGNKPLTAQRFAPLKVEANIANSTGKQILNDNQETDHILDVEVASKPLPPVANDQEDNMPAGNFYTSRGFWRKLEGDRLLWDQGINSSGEAQPPPKPQRTFQYQAAKSNNGAPHSVQRDGTSPQNNHSNVRSRSAANPPNFPPPPHPVVTTNGLSRHKKNRWVPVKNQEHIVSCCALFVPSYIFREEE